MWVYAKKFFFFMYIIVLSSLLGVQVFALVLEHITCSEKSIAWHVHLNLHSLKSNVITALGHLLRDTVAGWLWKFWLDDSWTCCHPRECWLSPHALAADVNSHLLTEAVINSNTWISSTCPSQSGNRKFQHCLSLFTNWFLSLKL